MTRRRVFIVIGTRPEAIKLAPVVRACRARPDAIDVAVCLTGQHRELVRPLVNYFDLRPDVDFELMTPGQSSAELAGGCITRLDEAWRTVRPDVVVVQGDTTTAMAAAVAAFLHRIPVVHVEAGLRTGNLAAPFPEEFQRRVITLAAALHAAPTERAAEHLRAEGVPPSRVVVTGNTAVDALLWTVERERSQSANCESKPAAATVLVTAHRRESFGVGLAGICAAIETLALAHPAYRFVWPLHPNPQVAEPVRARLSGAMNVQLTPPLEYPAFVRAMSDAVLILTDSGGVQEEAPSLGVPVLVLRDETERPEGIAAGCAELVGTQPARIVARAMHHLAEHGAGRRPPPTANPYGDGRAAERIVEEIVRMT